MEELTKAQKKLSLKVHPDKNNHPKSSDAFKKLNKVKSILLDTQKRKIYDQTGDGDRAENNGAQQQTQEA